jgi:hypothetical protein
MRRVLLLLCIPTAAFAITPVNGGLVTGGTTVTINNSAGDQTLPHVSGNFAAYTDVADAHIHCFNFGTSTDSIVPPGTSLGDTLSDVSGLRVASFVKLPRTTPRSRCSTRRHRRPR